jgi:uncharacterized membrane protein
MNNSRVYGASLFAAGALWLGEKLGWWPEQEFWPYLLIVLGVACVAYSFKK